MIPNIINFDDENVYGQRFTVQLWRGRKVEYYRPLCGVYYYWPSTERYITKSMIWSKMVNGKSVTTDKLWFADIRAVVEEHITPVWEFDIPYNW